MYNTPNTNNLSTYHREATGKISSAVSGLTSAPSVEAMRGIDQATLSKMRELAAAHRPPPAAPGVE